jgi:uncharacterized membrane protein YvbJ
VANICPECRFDNPEGTLFCGKCGTKFHSPEMDDAIPTSMIKLSSISRERMIWIDLSYCP